MAPKDPHLLASISMCNFSPWVWSGHGDLLLTDTIWWWHTSSMIRLQRDCGFPLAYPLLLARSVGRQITYSELPCGKAHVTKNSRRIPANSQGYLRLSVKLTISEPEVILPQGSLRMRPQTSLTLWHLVGDPEVEMRSQVSPGFLTHGNLEIVTVCCFKLLKFWSNLLCSNRWLT